MKKPILTVAIPTYNRSETLEKIIKELQQEKDEEFFILISDDNSSDETETLVRKYQKVMPHLIYHKNSTNLGYSGNVCKLYELAATQYIWFLCDDDTVISGAIKNIINAIITYKPVVAVFNTTWHDAYGRELISGVDRDIIYTNIDELVTYEKLMRITFLSIIVVEKRLPIDVIKKKAYTDNIFVQLTLALLLLSDKFIFCEIASPIVKRNVGYKYGEFFKFYLIDHLKAVSIIDHKFDNKKFITWSIAHIPTALLLYLSQKIGLFKYHGKPTKKTIKMIIKYYGIYSVFIFSFVLLYYLIPSIVIKYLYMIRLWKYHGRKKGLAIYKENVNRAMIDPRKTGFTKYR